MRKQKLPALLKPSPKADIMSLLPYFIGESIQASPGSSEWRDNLLCLVKNWQECTGREGTDGSQAFPHSNTAVPNLFDTRDQFWGRQFSRDGVGDGSGGNASDGERWGVVDEASLACLPADHLLLCGLGLGMSLGHPCSNGLRVPHSCLCVPTSSPSTCSTCFQWAMSLWALSAE